MRQGIPAPGYSDRINHPEILTAVKKNRKAARVFAFFLVPFPVIGAVLYAIEFPENIGKVRPTTSPDTGVRGVTLQKDGKYQAIIFFRRQRYYLGRYKNLDDAVRIRKAAEMLVDECLEDYKNGIPFPDKLPVEKLYKYCQKQCLFNKLKNF